MHDELVQVGVAGILIIQVLDRVFSFLKHQRQKREANGEDQDGMESAVNATYMRRLMESIDANTKAIKMLLDHEEDERRLLHRIEKVLDTKFEN